MAPPTKIPQGQYNEKSTYVLGVDPARTGKDQTGLIILEQPPFQFNIFVVYIELLHTPDLVDLKNKIIYLNERFNFKKIIIDETGLGAGVSDMLKEKFKGKVEGVWYTQNKKAEMFYNLKLLMTKKTSETEPQLFIPDYNTSNNQFVRKLYYQFLSIQQEFNERSIPRIFHEEHSHDDAVNALALAATYWKIGKSNRKHYGFAGFN